jgi:hypothetical protein
MKQGRDTLFIEMVGTGQGLGSNVQCPETTVMVFNSTKEHPYVAAIMHGFTPAMPGIMLLLLLSFATVHAEFPWKTVQQNDDFLALLQRKEPVNMHIFSEYTPGSDYVYDTRASGANARHLFDSSKVRIGYDNPVVETEIVGGVSNAMNPVRSLYVTPETYMRWNEESPPIFTMCSATRYHGTTAEGNHNEDILESGSHRPVGHDSGNRGMLTYGTYGEYFTSNGPIPVTNAQSTDWLIQCFTNGRSTDSYYFIDQTDWSGPPAGATDTMQRAIQVNVIAGKKSHCNIHSVYIWDTELSATDMKIVTAALRKEIGGVPDLAEPGTPAVIPIDNLHAYYLRFILAVIPPQSINIFADLDGSTVLDRSVGGMFPVEVTSGLAELVSGTGNGADNENMVLEGTEGTKILWPEDSIPWSTNGRTVCGVTRLISSSAKWGGSILSGVDIAADDQTGYYFGFMAGNRGMVIAKQQRTAWESAGVLDEWLVMCESSSRYVPGNVCIDQEAIGIDTTTRDVYGQLSVNYNTEQTSLFQLHSLYIWDQDLKGSQMKQITASLRAQIGGIPDFETEAVTRRSKYETAYEQVCKTGITRNADTGDCECDPGTERNADTGHCDTPGCVAGSHVDSNTGDCTPCPVGTYKPTTGTESCTTCPTYTSSPEGSDARADCSCSSGYFRFRTDSTA